MAAAPSQPIPQSKPASAETPRRPYTPPRVTVYGTVQTVTQGLGGGQGGSQLDDQL